MAERFRAIARVVKAHSNKGKVVVAALRGLPLLLEPGVEYVLVPPELRHKRFYRLEALEVQDTGALAIFEGIDTRDDAEMLVGKSILAQEANLPADFAALNKEGLLGREVYDTSLGLEGEIVEVMETPANDVWVVESSVGEFLLPVIASVVPEVPDEGQIEIRIPNGLLGGEDRAEL